MLVTIYLKLLLKMASLYFIKSHGNIDTIVNWIIYLVSSFPECLNCEVIFMETQMERISYERKVNQTFSPIFTR